MAEWAAKRFWSEVAVEEVAGGFALRLDGRPVRSPARTEVIVPTRALAGMMAQEWAAQGEMIDPLSMPATRSANAALDKVAPQRDAVEVMIAAFAETDLLCYRAPAPEALTASQAEAWDPLLDWAANKFGARLETTSGVMPVAQSAESLTRLRDAMGDLSVFQMAAFHDLVSLTGSYVLGLAIRHDRLSAEEAWDLSRLDEEWQIAQWGRDDEADALSALKRAQLLHAERFHRAATPLD